MVEALGLENERLAESIEQKVNDIDAWKLKYAELDKKSPLLKDFESKLAILAEDNRHLDSKVNMYSKEVERLNNLLIERTRDSEDLRLKISEMQSEDLYTEHESLKAEYSKLTQLYKECLIDIEKWRDKCIIFESSENRMGELEAKMEIMQRDNERQNDFILEKNNEVEIWKQRYHSLETSSSSKSN